MKNENSKTKNKKKNKKARGGPAIPLGVATRHH
jgi:hypothetical protein